MQQLTLLDFLSADDLTSVWDEFLPHALLCWRLQRESWSAGNCKDWWKSRFYDFFVGHGHGAEMIKKRLHHYERGTFNKFPDLWRQYGHILQSGKLYSEDRGVLMRQKVILDASCGSRMFWFDKKNPAVVFMDNRELDDVLCDGRKLVIKPDVLADFREIPFPDKSFKLVVFDPPHLIKAGKNSWLAKKYGVLEDTWRQDIKQGFDECMRVLDDYSTLIFKWNEEQISVTEIMQVIRHKPLFGNRRNKTHWLVFMKGV